jgi:hypothetical protein
MNLSPYFCFQTSTILRHPKAISKTKKPNVAGTTELRVEIIGPNNEKLHVRGLLDTGASKSINLQHDSHYTQIKKGDNKTNWQTMAGKMTTKGIATVKF